MQGLLEQQNDRSETEEAAFMAAATVRAATGPQPAAVAAAAVLAAEQLAAAAGAEGRVGEDCVRIMRTMQGVRKLAAPLGRLAFAAGMHSHGP